MLATQRSLAGLWQSIRRLARDIACAGPRRSTPSQKEAAAIDAARNSAFVVVETSGRASTASTAFTASIAPAATTTITTAATPVMPGTSAGGGASGGGSTGGIVMEDDGLTVPAVGT